MPNNFITRFKQILKTCFDVSIATFAMIGFLLTALFIASYYHLTDITGTIDHATNRYLTVNSNPNFVNNDIHESSPGAQFTLNKLNDYLDMKLVSFCGLRTIGHFAGDNASKIYDVYKLTSSDKLAANMINAVTLRMQNNQDFNSEIKACSNITDIDQILNDNLSMDAKTNVFPWVNDIENWEILSAAIAKDKDQINKAAKEAGIEPRLLVAPVFVEQWRKYTSSRELFKSTLKPFQVLITSSQFSLGVMDIKEDTAKTIETNLKDRNSQFYLGPEYENLLVFKTDNPDKERVDRLTDIKDHSYSYLYGALYMAQLMKQWQRAGFPIDDRPEIISTIYNIGFRFSKPNANPKVGGSEIDVVGNKYTFGGLAYEFYYSGELRDQFPFAVE